MWILFMDGPSMCRWSILETGAGLTHVIVFVLLLGKWQPDRPKWWEHPVYPVPLVASLNIVREVGKCLFMTWASLNWNHPVWVGCLPPPWASLFCQHFWQAVSPGAGPELCDWTGSGRTWVVLPAPATQGCQFLRLAHGMQCCILDLARVNIQD